MTLVVGAGTRVVTQNPENQGQVVARAGDGNLIVRWSDGDLTEEIPAAVLLTGALVLVEEGT